MLDLILELLRELELLEPGDQPPVVVQMTTGNNFLVNVYPAGRGFLHVRAAEQFDLSGEAAIAKAVFGALGRYVPRPVAYERRVGLDLVVFEGIEMAPVVPAQLRDAGRVGGIVRELESFFGLTVERHQNPNCSPTFDAEVLALRQRFRGTEREVEVEMALRRVEHSPLRRLPPIPQHGDLVANNLGWAQDRLIVYDWEDYGKSSLRGFDLAILLSSALRFDPAELKYLYTSGCDADAHRDAPGWFAPCCQALGLRPDEILAALPLFLLLFLRLKDPYSDHIKSMVTRAILELL